MKTNATKSKTLVIMGVFTAGAAAAWWMSNGINDSIINTYNDRPSFSALGSKSSAKANDTKCTGKAPSPAFFGEDITDNTSLLETKPDRDEGSPLVAVPANDDMLIKDFPIDENNDGLKRLSAFSEAKKSFAAELAERAVAEQLAATEIAREQGWAVLGGAENQRFELMSFQEGRPMIYVQNNVAAAITTGTRDARLRYPVSGAGCLAAAWDAGVPLLGHREFANRVTVGDDTTYVSSHMTRIVGTMIASGIEPEALGMAPAAQMIVYGWGRDVSEMAAIGMGYPGEPGTVQVSNHSYDYSAGWSFETYPPRWVGTLSHGESEYFGSYDHNASRWDMVCYETPYYLPFKAAANDRGDNAPVAGVPWTHWSGSEWVTKPYDPATDPKDDGARGGYDTLPLLASAKNPMVVGAVKDGMAVDGSRDTSRASMTSFSSWGPTDDGRIKPDIVANGWKVLSTSKNGIDQYSTINGTSIAVATASGSALLILDHYDKLFPGEYLRASMLKGLIIHTADDMGPAGPDYQFGWGLMNTEAALDFISAAPANPSAPRMLETAIATGETQTHDFTNDGQPITVTVSWTDPAAASSNFALNDRSSKLVHDLDVVLVSPSGTRTRAFKLDPANPAALAFRGDNDVDNVEQVTIANPTEPGLYTVEITVDGALSADEQVYSLLISGSLHPEVQPDSVPTVSLTLDAFSIALGSVSSSSAMHDLAIGTDITLIAATVEQNGMRYVPQGWIGTGNLNGGEGNTITFSLTLDSSITFNYVEETKLDQASSPAGIIDQRTWQPRGSSTSTLTAPASVDYNGMTYQFAYWTIDGARQADEHGFALDCIEDLSLEVSHQAVAIYELASLDADGDNKEDWWELRYFGDLTHNLDLDSDGDGYTDAAEYVTRTNPFDPADRFYFYVKNLLIVEPPKLAWTCKEGCAYTIYRKASLRGDQWIRVENPGITVDSENNAEWSDEDAWNADHGAVCIYKIDVSRIDGTNH